jgi:hypothetical protein
MTFDCLVTYSTEFMLSPGPFLPFLLGLHILEIYFPLGFGAVFFVRRQPGFPLGFAVRIAAIPLGR